MKKEEKTKRTCEKILALAIIEFGSKNYDNASITTICNENQISKGLLYHNFKNKDELYLKCVAACFEKMTSYLNSEEYKANTIKESIQNILSKRQKFFKEYPHYGNIFFNAILHPPTHLKKEIQEIRSEFDNFSKGYYSQILKETELREGITTDMATEYFIMFQEMFNTYFQNKIYKENDFHEFIKDHEINLSKILDIMLYGVAKK